MFSLIIIKRTKDLVKTGMCKINESPCQLQLEARCFIVFVLQGEWNGCFYSMDWFTVIFQSFSKKSHCFTVTAPPRSKAEHLRKATQKTFGYIWGGLWGLSTQRLAAQAFSSTSDPGAASFLQPGALHNRKHRTPLQTKHPQLIT